MLHENDRLNFFLQSFTELLETHKDEEELILAKGAKLLSELVRHDDWLPQECAVAHPDHYQQHLIYLDPEDRFSVISAVWSPGHSVPPHDHTVWGLVGQLRGSETSVDYEQGDLGKPMVPGKKTHLLPGQVLAVSPNIGDIHSVSNSSQSEVSISIHVYGGNIGAIERRIFDLKTSEASCFISGYS